MHPRGSFQNNTLSNGKKSKAKEDHENAKASIDLVNQSIKVHSQANIPFSWENKPGESKAAAAEQDDDNHHQPPPSKLPPPPCPLPETPRASFHDIRIPLPPCAFQPPSRSASKKGLKKMDDPFLNAYKEVTKSTKKGKSLLGGIKGDDNQGLGLMKSVSVFSCKQRSCGVAEDSVIKLSQLRISRSHRDGATN
ncbi:hypothetical protein ABFS83_03G037600 [Erythranthe nasuta]